MNTPDKTYTLRRREIDDRTYVICNKCDHYTVLALWAVAHADYEIEYTCPTCHFVHTFEHGWYEDEYR